MDRINDSEEIRAINDALLAFNRKHGNNVLITCSIVGFGEDFDVVEDSFWMCGNEEGLILQNEVMLEMIGEGSFDEEWE